MALSRGGAEGRTAGPLGFGPHLRPLCGPPLQQQHDFWSSPVSVGSTRRVKKKKSEKKGKSIIGIFSRICVLIILGVLLFPLSPALPAVASWHSLSRARTPQGVLLLEQQRPRRRAAPLCLGLTVDLREWWWRRSDTFWWNHRCRRASPW